jgi:hypothetical protein
VEAFSSPRPRCRGLSRDRITVRDTQHGSSGKRDLPLVDKPASGGQVSRDHKVTTLHVAAPMVSRLVQNRVLLGALNFCVRIAIAAIIAIPLMKFVGRTYERAGGYDIGSAMVIIAVALFFAAVLFLLFGIPFIQSMGEAASHLYEPGDENFRVVPEYSVAEARVKEGKYLEAVAEYRQVIEKFPADVYAHVRIAELAVEHLHDLKLAETELIAAQAKAAQEDAVVLAAHRLADLYQHQLNTPQRGLDVLLSVQGRLTNANHVKRTEERIESLRQFVDGYQVPQPPESIQLRKSRYRMHDDPSQHD